MTRHSGFILALALAACECPTARADHSISWGDNQPAANQHNMIAASGNCHVEPGWEISIVWIEVVPVGGGLLSTRACRVGTEKQTWSGRITPMKPGAYTVRLYMKLVNRVTLKRVTYASGLQSVTVAVQK